jgi:hypothetical protein
LELWCPAATLTGVKALCEHCLPPALARVVAEIVFGIVLYQWKVKDAEGPFFLPQVFQTAEIITSIEHSFPE